MDQKPKTPAAGKPERGTDALDPQGNVDAEKLKQNQRHLKVNPDHKTPDMEKGHRGTFP